MPDFLVGLTFPTADRISIWPSSASPLERHRFARLEDRLFGRCDAEVAAVEHPGRFVVGVGDRLDSGVAEQASTATLEDLPVLAESLNVARSHARKFARN
jgi:hypothetical protein